MLAGNPRVLGGWQTLVAGVLSTSHSPYCCHLVKPQHMDPPMLTSLSQKTPVAAKYRDWHCHRHLAIRILPLMSLQRDKDISPVMYCTSLIPGVWDRRWMEGQ